MYPLGVLFIDAKVKLLKDVFEFGIRLLLVEIEGSLLMPHLPILIVGKTGHYFVLIIVKYRIGDGYLVNLEFAKVRRIF